MGIDAEMFVRTRISFTDEEIKRLSYALAESLGAEHFFVQKKTFGPDDKAHGALDRIDIWQQDGPEIIPEEGETFLRVYLWTRYYGIGYERGDLLFICAVAEWLEQNIYACEVWYGGDSSGVLAEPFPESKRRGLKSHLYSRKGRDYFQSFSSLEKEKLVPPTEGCELCIEGRTPIQYGFGHNYGTFSCAGCGYHFKFRDGKWKTARNRQMLEKE